MMLTSNLNEHSNLSDIVAQVRKKVNRLLLTYFALIASVILLSLILFSAVIIILANAFESGSGFDIRVIIIMLCLFVFSVACVFYMLDPLFKMFESRKTTRREIKRKDYRELFEMIDEVAAKVNCRFPKHVYISNDCNAYVFYPNIWGYIFPGRQNLTIGIPLLLAFNKTELKSILSHEFGHFTQKSIKMNSIANLAEFICSSINQSCEELDNSAEIHDNTALLFAHIVTKIMTKHYMEVAPLNGILSRAQEFDADAYSYQVVGTDGAISALSKISHFSRLWDDATGYIKHLMRDEKRVPQNIKMVVDAFLNDANNKTSVTMEPTKHLLVPMSENNSKLSWVNEYTHPTMTNRCDAIKRMPYITTNWDNTPAITFFQSKVIEDVFNDLIPEFTKELFPYSTEFFKNDVTSEVVKCFLDERMPNYLSHFYNSTLFYSYQTFEDICMTNKEYESFPFTPSNADVLEKYNIASNDLYNLQQIINENSSARSFYYDNIPCTGTNVPIKKHRDYYAPLAQAAEEIARHCNYWMLQKANQDNDNGLLFHLIIHTGRLLADINELRDTFQTIIELTQRNDTSTKAIEYVNHAESHFRTASQPIMDVDSDGQSKFLIISKNIEVKSETLDEITNYFSKPQSESNKELMEVYRELQQILVHFYNKTLTALMKEWVVPEIVKVNYFKDIDNETLAS